eukprot:2062499-Amphidinium_carterae.5
MTLESALDVIMSHPLPPAYGRTNIVDKKHGCMPRSLTFGFDGSSKGGAIHHCSPEVLTCVECTGYFVTSVNDASGVMVAHRDISNFGPSWAYGLGELVECFGHRVNVENIHPLLP